MVRASGFQLWDSSGKQYLDLSSGISATAGIGQGRPEVAEAMAAQARTLSFVHNSRVTNDQQELLAARLTDLAPEGVGKVMFTSGGSEANELSIRIARQYHLARGDWERTKIIALSPSYHGATVGALSMTGRWDVNRAYDPHLMHTVKVTAPVNFRGPFAGLEGEALADRAAAAVDAAIEATGPHTVSAVMVEPVSPSAGMAVPPASYWPRVREICDRHGVLLITDEIVTGAGRTGEFLAMDHFGVVADLCNLAKGLSGGYVPLGATLVRDRDRRGDSGQQPADGRGTHLQRCSHLMCGGCGGARCHRPRRTGGAGGQAGRLPPLPALGRTGRSALRGRDPRHRPHADGRVRAVTRQP